MQVRDIHPAHERADLCELRPPPILCCHRAAPTDKPLERLRNRVESRLAQRPIQMRGFVRWESVVIRWVIAHPASARVCAGSLAAKTNWRTARTDAPLTLAV